MIYWLASYPKSGNTWLRTLLTNYLRNLDVPADINHLDGGPIASSRRWFDEWTGVEASLLSDETIERLRPEVYRCIVRENTEPLYMKVHDAWKRTGKGEALFPADVTAGVIYAVRNPLDVAMSWANHQGSNAAKAVADLCNPQFSMSRSMDDVANQLRQYLGSWSHHAHSWVNESGLPVFVVRYEDMRQDTEKFFGGVIRFCGLPFDEARIKKAVAFSSFGELQKQETEKGFRERLPKSNGAFFRQGKVGGWSKELTGEQAEQIIAANGEVMRQFGYIP